MYRRLERYGCVQCDIFRTSSKNGFTLGSTGRLPEYCASLPVKSTIAECPEEFMNWKINFGVAVDLASFGTRLPAWQ
jgi:hypothetical protein